MDERSNLFVTRAMGITLGILYLGTIVSCIWKYIVTKDSTNSTLEIILIVAIPVSIGWFARGDESLALPKDLTGTPLSTSQEEVSKKVRKKHYVWHTLAFALFILIMDSIAVFLIEKDFERFLWFPNLSDRINVWIVLALEFLFGFIIFYAIGYLINEQIVRKYNKKIDDLENNDE